MGLVLKGIDSGEVLFQREDNCLYDALGSWTKLVRIEDDGGIHMDGIGGAPSKYFLQERHGQTWDYEVREVDKNGMLVYTIANGRLYDGLMESSPILTSTDGDHKALAMAGALIKSDPSYRIGSGEVADSSIVDGDFYRGTNSYLDGDKKPNGKKSANKSKSPSFRSERAIEKNPLSNFDKKELSEAISGPEGYVADVLPSVKNKGRKIDETFFNQCSINDETIFVEKKLKTIICFLAIAAITINVGLLIVAIVLSIALYPKEKWVVYDISNVVDIGKLKNLNDNSWNNFKKKYPGKAWG